MKKFIYEGLIRLNEFSQKSRRISFLYNSTQSGRERSWFRAIVKFPSSLEGNNLSIQIRAGLAGSELSYQDYVHAFIMLIAFDTDQEEFLNLEVKGNGLLFNDFNEEIGVVILKGRVNEEVLSNGAELH